MDTVAAPSGQPMPKMDDATLLRQAALLSLKAKRRTGPMPRSPTPRTDPDAVTLVYDEPPPDIAAANSSAESRVVPEANPPSHAELEDGEISDPEGIPVNGTSGKTEIAPPPDPPPKLPQTPNQQVSVFPVTSSKPLRVVTVSPKTRMGEDPPSTLSDSVPSHSSSRPSPSVVARLPSPTALANLRSKLQMTPQDIFEAKVVILDILGWGIPASFLLDCGVSPLAVVVCLSELKLRIPEGLIAIVEEAENEVQAASANSPDKGETVTISPIGSNMAVSSPDLSPKNQPSSLPSRPSFLPPKPPTASKPPKNPVPSGEQPVPISPTPVQPTPVDLNDIEQQRKQELMARRAVLQSLKGKSNPGSSLSASNPSIPSSPSVQALHPPQIQPSALQEFSTTHDMQIDMFIADAITRSEDLPKNIQREAEESPRDAMEVEQALQSTEKEEYTPVSALVFSSNSGIEDSPLDMGHHLDNGSLTPGTSRPGTLLQHRSSENGNSSSFATPPVPGSPTSVSSPSISLQSRVSAIASASLKRIGKRPVAADFVDYIPSDQSRSRFDSAYTDPGPPHHKRRKHFGPVVSHRLVIDVSDGEAGTDEDDDHIPEPRTISALNGSVTQTSPESHREGSAPVDDHKLKLLEEKQKEILRMRELIRSMEEKKRRTALAESASSGEGETTRSVSEATTDGSTSVLRPLSTNSIHPPHQQISGVPVLSAHSFTVKTEDVSPDFMPGTEFHGKKDSSSAAADSTSGTVAMSNFPSSNTIAHIPFDSHTSSSTLIVDDQRQDHSAIMNTADNNSPGLGWNGTDAQGTSTSSVEIAGNSRHGSDNPVPVESNPVFRPYISPFALYPSLRPQSSSLHSSLTIVPASASPFASSYTGQIQQPDPRQLRWSQLFHFADPQRRLCQYEIPGGGTCRDDSCQDLHHRNLVPDDGEIARFVAPSLPDFTREQILHALSSLRLASTLETTGQYPLQADPLSQRVADAVQLLMSNSSGEIVAS